MASWLCWLSGHDWAWYLFCGDYGEPARDKCLRCGEEELRAGRCRCVIECNCGHLIFVFEDPV